MKALWGINALVFLFLPGREMKAQNLVPNSSFEVYTACPSGTNQTQYATPWLDVQPTSDYYNCSYLPSGCPLARTGTGFMGVSVYRPDWSNPYREYIGAPLLSALTSGTTYYCEFWVKLECDKCWASDALGALFTIGQPPQQPGWNMLNPATPQIMNIQYRMLDDRQNWMKICGTFTASGGEDFITIGSFKDDQQSTFVELSGCNNGNYSVHWSYYFIDDVYVVPYDTTETYSCDDTSVYENPNPPAEDMVYDKECEIVLPNVLSPNGDGLNDELIIPDTLIRAWQLDVYNRWGQTEFSGSSKYDKGWDGKSNRSTPLPDGTYFYILISSSEACYSRGIITLFNEK